MKETISIRSYNLSMQSHSHDFHQLVLPLNGVIEITLGEFIGKVSVGEGIAIQAGQEHGFRAQEAARFVVIDLKALPENLQNLEAPKFAIGEPLLAYMQFVDKQLSQEWDEVLACDMMQVLKGLLAKQSVMPARDERIAKVLLVIREDVSRNYAIQELADIACLSPTQFKKRFTEDMKVSPGVYISRLKMEKARALLAYTDLPIGLVAQNVGYADPSAFSRRFREVFGQPPGAFQPK